MVLVYFSCSDPQGEYYECSYGGETIETCLDSLSQLVRNGWQLISVKLSESQGNAIWLPVEAFDGQPIKRSLQLLQREWEAALLQH
ncbi:hypothetical protein [Spirosoma endophyticum]|uniref:Uncharacterized protein n=1 Tax=Spirosoma endophyticum TaxID=662367 RepID=A0A1I2HW74_9BACT|nr:hypothetical protein [Spirosoma endophyticum]SFF32987.1 hypothetical protein SAMN05216167_14822 [Spirosoma endophyticum]